MKNSFSFSRFGALASAHYTADMHGNLRKIGGFIALVSILFFMVNINTRELNGQRLSNAPMYISMLMMLSIAVWVFLIAGGFRDYFKEKKASFYLMLPAARSEKFTLVFINSLIVTPLILTLVALLSSMLWFAIFEPTGFIKFMTDKWGESPLYLNYKGILSLFFIMSLPPIFFFWGSAIFRRHQLIFSLITFFLTWTAALTILNKFPDFRNSLHFSSNDFYIFAAIMLAVEIGLIVWAWLRFSKLQITR